MVLSSDLALFRLSKNDAMLLKFYDINKNHLRYFLFF